MCSTHTLLSSYIVLEGCRILETWNAAIVFSLVSSDVYICLMLQ